MDMPVEKKIVFELNGRSVEALEGETILEAADRIGVEIPRLCYKEGIRADGNCRACVVEIDGERALAPSCCRYPTEGMKVTCLLYTSLSPRDRQKSRMPSSA